MRLVFFAHSGGPFTPDVLWTAWNIEPSLLVPLGVTAFIYLWGVWNVWQRAGAGRGISVRRCVSFLGAILALIVALVSPLDAASNVLFSAHMAQHLILILVAAPLLVVSDFPLALLWALPRHWAQALGQRLNHSRSLSRAWRVMSNPVSAWLLFAAAMWGWHAPKLYEAALQSEMLHDLEHLMFLATALLYWWALFKPIVRRNGANGSYHGMAILNLFTTAIQSGVLGALMTFSSQSWYPYYSTLVEPWGLTSLQDQQLAGLIMWLLGGVVFNLMAIGYFASWLRALEQRSEQLQNHKSLRTTGS